jgi:hypothetical protein
VEIDTAPPIGNRRLLNEISSENFHINGTISCQKAHIVVHRFSQVLNMDYKDTVLSSFKYIFSF